MRYLIILIVSLISISAFAQTGIGTTTPHASAKLDVSATNKGFLPPRVTLTSATDASTISSPAEGLLVYNLGSSGLQAGYYYWNGANWATIATASSAGNGMTSMDMVKLYGEAHSKASGKIGNSTTGYVFTVPVSGRYLFDFTSASTALGGGTNTIYFTVRQGTTVLASDMQSSYNNNVHVEYNGKVEVNLQAGISYNVYNYATSGSFETNDYDRVYYKLVAGNLPVTGQSVDYIQASLSANQSISSVGNVLFNTSSGAGITITSGGFNLSANKTYKLEAAIGGAASTGYAYYGWVDNNNNLLPGGSTGAVIKAGNVHSDAPQDKAIVYFTPTVNTTVFLRVYNLYGTVTAYAPSLSTNYSSTWASIQQVGSSAFVNPWVLSGTNTYNTTGNVGIGTTSPSTNLHIENGNIFGSNPDVTTSPSLYIYNNNNTSTSAHSSLAIRTNGNGGGNPYVSFDINGVRGYSMGIDNADADKFKIHTNWSLNNSVTPALTITSDGRLGLGTTSPSAALHVASSVTQAVGAYGYLSSGGAGTSGVNQNINYSIQADQRIRAPEFNAISDARIKKNILKINPVYQLADLNKLQVVNYSYIDQLVNGNINKTGFIAQEVETVNPKFINKSIDFIPSVFALAKSVNLVNDLLQVSTDKPHDFKNGDIVKFFVGGKKEIISSVENVIDPKSFTVKAWNNETDNLFIYGKKVTDFRAIDFDQITALSVGAIQALDQKVGKLERENEILKKLIKSIEINLLKIKEEIKK